VIPEMWISNNGNWKNMTFKCPVNIADLTFGESGLDYINSDTTITVSNGWVEPDAGLSTTCNVTDKISFEISFGDAPDVTYQAIDTRKTGFIKDED